MGEDAEYRDRPPAGRREYRGLFAAGRRFRVARPGCRLVGMQPDGPGCQRGWARDLAVGDVLTCAGESMTSGDGVPAVKWRGAAGEWLANDCTFWPVVGGLWGGQLPPPGALEPAD
jgi:hypothetical protein